MRLEGKRQSVDSFQPAYSFLSKAPLLNLVIVLLTYIRTRACCDPRLAKSKCLFHAHIRLRNQIPPSTPIKPRQAVVRKSSRPRHEHTIIISRLPYGKKQK